MVAMRIVDSKCKGTRERKKKGCLLTIRFVSKFNRIQFISQRVSRLHSRRKCIRLIVKLSVQTDRHI
jgi:hypothetical protein